MQYFLSDSSISTKKTFSVEREGGEGGEGVRGGSEGRE